MAAGSPTLDSLRQLVAARFPQRSRPAAGHAPTGVPAIDEALGGGLPAGQLTELVSAAPSSGGQLVFSQLLVATRAARKRVALVDGADGFDPAALPIDALRHLVWARCDGLAQAMSAADILVRDGNYGVVVLDLRGLDRRELRRLAGSAWYRLQRAAEGGPASVLVQTPFPLVPAAPWRLVLEKPLSLASCRLARSAIAASLAVGRARGRAAAEELAG
jgi:hypothetical protein